MAPEKVAAELGTISGFGASRLSSGRLCMRIAALGPGPSPRAKGGAAFLPEAVQRLEGVDVHEMPGTLPLSPRSGTESSSGLNGPAPKTC